MNKILITGGAGFVGRHFCRYFLDNLDEVHCVDKIAAFTGGIHPKDGWPLFSPLDYQNFKFYHQDCRQFFNERTDDDFDYVLHLAAMVGGRLMIENNPLAVADDLSIDSEFFQWAANARPAKSVCFSSSAAYPIQCQKKDNYLLLREDMIDFNGDIGMPDMSYGWSKLTMEYLARLAYQKHGLKSVVYRPFSGYGEDQDDTYPFPAICKRILRERNADQIVVWGSGEQMRDFIHIDDCVAGVVTTMDHIDNGEAINLSTGIYTSFKAFAGSAANIVGFDPLVKGTSDKPEGVFARAGDTTKQKQLNFHYKIDFKTGIQRALVYFDTTER